MHLATGDNIELIWTRADGKRWARYDSKTDVKSVDEVS